MLEEGEESGVGGGHTIEAGERGRRDGGEGRDGVDKREQKEEEAEGHWRALPKPSPLGEGCRDSGRMGARPQGAGSGRS